jgi:hypothetical protein
MPNQPSCSPVPPPPLNVPLLPTCLPACLPAGVVGHEYFHNWTGNRVTCRDWFQLTLKEGLTVYRDQVGGCTSSSWGFMPYLSWPFHHTPAPAASSGRQRQRLRGPRLLQAAAALQLSVLTHTHTASPALPLSRSSAPT